MIETVTVEPAATPAADEPRDEAGMPLAERREDGGATLGEISVGLHDSVIEAVTGRALSEVEHGKLSRADKQRIDALSLARAKPRWFRIRLPGSGEFASVAATVREHGLHTICEEGRCPNMGECWGKGTATFQILGDTCTRACRYCNVKTGWPGTAADPLEPAKVAQAIRLMGVQHAVVTSVDRDDLPDRGAGQFAALTRAVRRQAPGSTLELLTPDFFGREEEALRTVIGEQPDVFAHNIETVPRLYRRIRPKGGYRRAMELLLRAKEVAVELHGEPVMTKSGIIAGMGETVDEIKGTMRDLREHGVDVVTIGQYLRPTRRHAPIDRFYTLDEFRELTAYGEEVGFGSCFAGPLVRSSYKAEEQRMAALQPDFVTVD